MGCLIHFYKRVNMSGPMPILTHAQRVCRLYKKSLRTLEHWNPMRHELRFNAAILRARFEETRDETDMRVQAKRLEEAEKEWVKEQHLDPLIFKNDPGGICYDRDPSVNDWMFDHYHPWERAQLRDFFEQREHLKKDYEEYYEKSLVNKYKPEPQII